MRLCGSDVAGFFARLPCAEYLNRMLRKFDRQYRSPQVGAWKKHAGDYLGLISKPDDLPSCIFHHDKSTLTKYNSFFWLDVSICQRPMIDFDALHHP